MHPVHVTVITYAPTVFRHCQHCEVAFEGMGLGERIHRAEARDALPDDLAAEYQLVSDWIHRLIEQHGGRLSIDVVDAASIEGVWQSLRHRVRKYPAVIIDRHERRAGIADFAELDVLIERALAANGESATVKGAA